MLDNYVPAKELALQAAESERLSTKDTIKAIRDQVQVKFGSERLGNLLSKYHVDRDHQMATLTGLGKDVLLSLMSQGILPATVAESLEVSYDIYHEFIQITCTKEEIRHMEMLQADSLVAEGVKELNKAEDKDDLAIAKAKAEMNLKLAKALSGRYTEQKPTTAVQVNNYNTGPEGDEMQVSFVKYPQMTVPDVESLPELREHAYKSMEDTQADQVIEGFSEGDFFVTNIE